MKQISIAIPTYEMHGEGVQVLEFSFEKMKQQTFKNFDVVISDHSSNDDILNLCEKWKNDLDIKYFKNEEDKGSPSANTTSAIKKSTGKWIKILCQDDFLYNQYSLERIYDFLDEKTVWMASSYMHSYDRKTFFKYQNPSMNEHICVVNTIGTPSCITIRNVKDIPEFDKELFYAYDCAWYHELWKKYGNPKILQETTMINFLWNNSISSKITPEFIQKENEYILRKYGFLK